MNEITHSAMFFLPCKSRELPISYQNALSITFLKNKLWTGYIVFSIPTEIIQAFEFWKASNNNFSKRYRVVHTRSDLSIRRPCIAVLHPASIEVSPVCLESKKKDP